MNKKLTGKALAKFESSRDVWQEVLDGVREIKAGGGKRKRLETKLYVVRVRSKSGLSQAEFAMALDILKRAIGTMGARPPGAIQRREATVENSRAPS
jgi:putative transcriptional regulator